MKKVFIKEYQALSPTSGKLIHMNVGKIMDPDRMVSEEFKYQTETVSTFYDTSHLIGTMYKCDDLVTFQLYRYGNSC